MKKIILILVICLLVLSNVLLGLTIFYMYPIENNPGYSSIYKMAYRLEVQDTVKLTLYNASAVSIKTIKTFYFENNRVSKITEERHYNTRMQAQISKKEAKEQLKNVKVSGNIIYGEADISGYNGYSKDSLVESLEAYKDLYQEIK